MELLKHNDNIIERFIPLTVNMEADNIFMKVKSIHKRKMTKIILMNFEALQSADFFH